MACGQVDGRGVADRHGISAQPLKCWNWKLGSDDDRDKQVDRAVGVDGRIEHELAGGGDFHHHDLEDIVAVVDGRTELIGELRASGAAVRRYVARTIALLLPRAQHSRLRAV